MDPDVQKTILDALADGNYLGTAAKLGGVHPDTLQDWLRRGRAGREGRDVPGLAKASPELIEFVERIDLTLAEWEAETVRTINQTARSGAPNTWQAAMTMLERKFPDRWGRRDQVTVEGGDKPLVQLNQVILADPIAREQSRELLRRVAGWGIEGGGPLPLEAAEIDADDDE